MTRMTVVVTAMMMVIIIGADSFPDPGMTRPVVLNHCCLVAMCESDREKRGG